MVAMIISLSDSGNLSAFVSLAKARARAAARLSTAVEDVQR